MRHSQLERVCLRAASLRLESLRHYLNTIDLTEESDVETWFASLATIKQVQGNFNNDISFVACLLAKRYLFEHFGVSFCRRSSPECESW
jgi:hypothetical protein